MEESQARLRAKDIIKSKAVLVWPKQGQELHFCLWRNILRNPELFYDCQHFDVSGLKCYTSSESNCNKENKNVELNWIN